MNESLQAALSAQVVGGDVPRLPVGAYRLRFENHSNDRLKGFTGSAWRGAFGHALKRIVCVTQLRQCSECMLYRSCVYPYVFDTPPPAQSSKMRKYEAAPHPFVVHVPLNGMQSAETLEIGVNLFGRANDHLAHVISAFRRAAAVGIGRQRKAFQLIRVEQSPTLGNEWQTIHECGGGVCPWPPVLPDVPPLPTEVRVRLLSPLRIRRDGTLVNVETFSFADFFNVLLRRVSMLTYFHTDTPLETDFKALVERSRDVSLRSTALRWYDWTRYSSRQKRTMKMGGLIGECTVDGTVIEPFWPYLWLGQWTHAGKGASMGLGHYEICPRSSEGRTDLTDRGS